MATLDLSIATDRVRLSLGDTSDLPWLSDDEIDYALSYNNNNENAATKQCAGFILARMAYNGHEKMDKLEFWGETVFSQFRTYLKDIINNPVYAATGSIYVAGMNKEDIAVNNGDSTIVQHKLPVYPYEDYNNEDIRTTPLGF